MYNCWNGGKEGRERDRGKVNQELKFIGYNFPATNKTGPSNRFFVCFQISKSCGCVATQRGGGGNGRREDTHLVRVLCLAQMHKPRICWQVHCKNSGHKLTASGLWSSKCTPYKHQFEEHRIYFIMKREKKQHSGKSFHFWHYPHLENCLPPRGKRSRWLIIICIDPEAS